MELLLWRWSTAVQITSAVLIVGFFIALARTLPRPELRPWLIAWVANLGALLATVAFWFLQPEGTAAVLVLRVSYFYFKSVFAILLVVGAIAFTRPGWDPAPVIRRTLLPLLAFAAVAGFAAGDIPQIGVVQAGLISLVLPLGAWVLISSRVPGAIGLVAGFAARWVLAVAETLAYGAQAFQAPMASDPTLSLFLAAHSSLDTAAEWGIALGCVLLLYRTVQGELEDTNRELRATQSILQGLVDRDPLTGLLNRRGLSSVLRIAHQTGATLLFFDLDDFKAVNDVHGHEAGDRHLKFFSRALASTFRPFDDVIRYGGDEFVVVAKGAEPDQVLPRVEEMRVKLATDGSSELPIGFSVGHSYMPPEGDPDEALRAADQAMYTAKPTVRKGSPGRRGADASKSPPSEPGADAGG